MQELREAPHECVELSARSMTIVTSSSKSRRLSAIVMLSILGMVGLCAETSSAKTAWYQGGTLHSETALAWQTATTANKLATCADFLAMAYKRQMLKPTIQTGLRTMDDFRPYARELMLYLNAATRPDPDTEENRKLFGKQRISELAATGMIQMGWTR